MMMQQLFLPDMIGTYVENGYEEMRKDGRMRMREGNHHSQPMHHRPLGKIPAPSQTHNSFLDNGKHGDCHDGGEDNDAQRL